MTDNVDLGSLVGPPLWAALRRRGVSTSTIARANGVSHQWVSRVTAQWGPFPRAGAIAPELVERWVDQRRQGRSAERIAREYGLRPERVLRETAGHGPFRVRHSEPGWLGVSEIAEVLKISLPTLLRWCDAGFLPSGIVGDNGRRQWRAESIDQWLESAGLDVCPECGARSRDGLRHTAAVHG